MPDLTTDAEFEAFVADLEAGWRALRERKGDAFGLPDGTIRKVDRFGGLVLGHLAETSPEKGPWEGDPREWASQRLLPKAQEVGAMLEAERAGFPANSQLARLNEAALRDNVIKLATRVFILMDRLGMLEDKR